MTYKSFEPREAVNYQEAEQLLGNEEKDFEFGLMQFYPNKNIAVKEYKLINGPLIQLEVIARGTHYIPDDSKILSIRVLGNDSEIDEFKKRINSRFKEITTLKAKDIGTLDREDLERLSRNGFVIKHEFGATNIIESVI